MYKVSFKFIFSLVRIFRLKIDLDIKYIIEVNKIKVIK